MSNKKMINVDSFPNIEYMCVRCLNSPIFRKETVCDYQGCDGNEATFVLSLRIGSFAFECAVKEADRFGSAIILSNQSVRNEIEKRLYKKIIGKFGDKIGSKKNSPETAAAALAHHYLSVALKKKSSEPNKEDIFRISGFRVEKLFGVTDYEVKFDISDGRKVSIFIGPNGFGKTTTLLMANATLNVLLSPDPIQIGESIRYLHDLTFERFELNIEDKFYLNVTKTKQLDLDFMLLLNPLFIGKDTPNDLVSGYMQNDWYGANYQDHLDALDQLRKAVSNVWDPLPSHYLIQANRYQQEAEKAQQGQKQIDELISNEAKTRSAHEQAVDSLNDSYLKFRSEYEVSLDILKANPDAKIADKAKAQLTSSKDEFDQKIKTFFDDFKNNNVANQFVHNRLDFSQNPSTTKAIEDDFHNRLSDINAKLVSFFENKVRPSKLIRTSLAKQLSDSPSWTSYKNKYMKWFFSSTSTGTSSSSANEFANDIFDFFHRFDEFSAAFVSMDFSDKHKTIVLSDKTGSFSILTPSGDEITLKDLSSGEYNYFVVMYRVIITSKKNTVILLDEPEISLHIAIQEILSEEIIRFADEYDSQVIMVTHSPFIASNHDDLLAKVISGGQQQ
jgi:ABC-type lipoprotein export system ATPase subunit